MRYRSWFVLTVLFGVAVYGGDAVEVDITFRQEIPVRDGVNLSATIWKPAAMEEPLPVILVMTPYVSDETHARAMRYARGGYVYVSLDRRGRGNSEGVFKPLFANGPDGYDAIAWLAKQPWCDGRVAMRGGSYRGMVQWQILAQNPPALQTVIPTAAVFPGHDYPNPGGILLSYMTRWLSFTGGVTRNSGFFGDSDYWRAKYLKMYSEHQPFHTLAEMTGANPERFKLWLDHPAYDDFWRAHNPMPEQYRTIDIPVLSITGYFDGDQPGAMRYIREYFHHAPKLAEANHYLLIGPWDHGGTRTPRKELGGFNFDEKSVLDMDALHIEWYDWILKGKERPALIKDRVNYYVMGEDAWHHAPGLEQLFGRELTYYLSSPGSEASDVFHSGMLAEKAPETQSPDTYRYDPLENPAAEGYLDTGNIDGFFLDQAHMMRPHQLFYHGPALEEDVTVIGDIKATLYLSMNVPDTDIVVSLYIVDPDGKSLLLGYAPLRARFRKSLSEEHPVTSGEIEPYVFDGFWFTCRRIEKGSRIRLVVGPLDVPDFQKNYNSGGRIGHETAKDARTADIELHMSGQYPSSVTFPLLKADQ